MADNWVLITGGSRGIGQALVCQLASEWSIFFTGRREAGIAQTLARARPAQGARWLEGAVCDGSDDAAVTQLAARLLAERGAPAAIIHNAGIARDGLHIHQSPQAWRTLLDNNLIAIVNWHQALLPAMMVRGSGAIVLMSSVTAFKGNSGQTAYGASKAAMMGMARSLAQEVGRFGLRVNCLAPGLIASDMLDDIPAARLKTLRQAIPLRRLGTPEEVAHAAAFLIADQSRYLTGHTLVLDGGLTA
ncbi:SDR family NAD(P)-dependent oxidoreductase [Pantoea sp. 1.19]|uniref:SDR family NAD(P)-dependent oxidoreductase n=1 Tax=Pantoea sp. 1.19 TaxID=1925589 RepID=UPI00094912D0|nr:SDR family oxidoreductase [Pantoea sp. 1.19]